MQSDRPRPRGRPPKKTTQAIPPRSTSDELPSAEVEEEDVPDFGESAAGCDSENEEIKPNNELACPDVLTTENVRSLDIIMLIDFWGPDAKKGRKSHAGTLEDVLEPDLRVGEEVLLIAPEEAAFAEGQLCYRHEMIVKEVGAHPAFANQVKLKFKKWPAPKYDIWVDKRSWKMERATKERLQQRSTFNAMYEKVKNIQTANATRKIPISAINVKILPALGS